MNRGLDFTRGPRATATTQIMAIDRAALQEPLDHLGVARSRTVTRSSMLTVEETGVHGGLHEPRQRPPVDK